MLHTRRQKLADLASRESGNGVSARRAETLLGRSAEYFAEVEAHGFRAQALLGLGLLHKAKKRGEKAKKCLAEAEGLFEQMGAEVFLRQTRETLAELSA